MLGAALQASVVVEALRPEAPQPGLELCKISSSVAELWHSLKLPRLRGGYHNGCEELRQGCACPHGCPSARGAAAGRAWAAEFISPLCSLSMNISANEFAGRNNCMDSSFYVGAC